MFYEDVIFDHTRVRVDGSTEGGSYHGGGDDDELHGGIMRRNLGDVGVQILKFG